MNSNKIDCSTLYMKSTDGNVPSTNTYLHFTVMNWYTYVQVEWGRRAADHSKDSTKETVQSLIMVRHDGFISMSKTGVLSYCASLVLVLFYCELY